MANICQILRTACENRNISVKGEIKNLKPKKPKKILKYMNATEKGREQH